MYMIGTDYERLTCVTGVRQVERDKAKKRYKYAFEFMEMQPTEVPKLTRAIYAFRRQFLKRR